MADDVSWNGECVDGATIDSGVYDVHFTAWDRLGYVNSAETKTLKVVGIAKSLSDVFVYPNPYKLASGNSTVKITGLPIGCTVTIYTVSGDVVVYYDSVAGGEVEIIPEQLGLASGVYLYRITSIAGESTIGKFAIIK